MPTDQDLLLAAFNKARDYFNQHDFTAQTWTATMEGLLDPQVAMKRLDDPGYHVGAAVKDYFVNGNGKTERAKVTYLEPKDCYIVGNLGFVSGLAEFIDRNGEGHRPSHAHRIAYSFTYSKASGSWKAVHLWGAYVA